MKQKLSFNQKQILLCLACLLGILILFLGIFSATTPTRQFHTANKQLFQEEMLSNTLNMHYTLAYPREYGIPEYEAILPAYNRENRSANQMELTEQLNFYQNLDATKLSAEDTYTLSLLCSYLENTLELSKYPYYEEPLSPSSGMQSQLPILLAEYTFRCKQDVEDYLKLLDQTDEYFHGLLTFEQEKEDAGLLMSSVSMDKVIEQCDTILTASSLEKGTHFLQTTFEERLQELQQKNLLMEKEVQQYIHQNNRLLSTVMLPAYKSLGDGLLVLKDEKRTLQGLAATEAGKKYYEKLLISETGSYRSMEELKQLLVGRLDEEFHTLVTLLSQYEEPFFSEIQTSLDTCFPYHTPEQILPHLAKYMSADFPAMSTESTAPTVRVKNISKSLEDYCAPAFYLTPPLDDTECNVIYINQKNSPTGLELYTTLAHEGYPGHLYQSVYSNNLLASQNNGAVRQLLWYGGYLEGWALYVEFLSYDYASRLMEEAGYSAQAEYIQVEKHNRSLQLCLYSLLDIMIHHENASYNQVHRTLANFGISTPETTAAIYEYIVEEPANYPKYYLGYLEILELQKEAGELWSNQYSHYAFHQFFLENGPADFRSLEEQLRKTSLE